MRIVVCSKCGSRYEIYIDRDTKGRLLVIHCSCGHEQREWGG